MAFTLTPRDEELLDVLARRVRVLSLSQVARTWWPHATEKTALTRLHALAEAGYAVLAKSVGRSELELEAPLATWQPGCPPPAMRPVVLAARSRWAKSLPRITIGVVASAACGVQFGGRGGRLPRATEWTHDVHLAQVYLRMRAELPTRASSWRHEDLEPQQRSSRVGEKLPDALVTDGVHNTAIELVGGSYDVPKLDTFHEYCALQGIAYELW